MRYIREDAFVEAVQYNADGESFSEVTNFLSGSTVPIMDVDKDGNTILKFKTDEQEFVMKKGDYALNIPHGGRVQTVFIPQENMDNILLSGVMKPMSESSMLVNTVELSTMLAEVATKTHYVMQGMDDDDFIIPDEDGTKYSDHAQKVFDKYYDDYYALIETTKVK